MCGIVAAAAKREVSEILLEGLRRLEYRGYDSAGMALVDNDKNLKLHKALGRVAELESAQRQQPLLGCLGVAHTRWATHGEPSTANAHPHTASNRFAVVHNGIIENHAVLRSDLEGRGIAFLSQTDTEVIVHLIDQLRPSCSDLLSTVQQVVKKLEGAYAIAVIDSDEPDTLVVAREGSPLVLGLGIGEMFAGSDTLALRSVTDTFIYLEDGDIGCLKAGSYELFDSTGTAIEREVSQLEPPQKDDLLGSYDHYMLKEIHEQPQRLRDTIPPGRPRAASDFGPSAAEVFSRTKAVQIIACGTSYHAGLVAKYWIEAFAKIPCSVEVASELRYREPVVVNGTLIVSISQSGETADTLAAINHLGGQGIARLAVCNVDHSAIVRASELVFLTQAGAEIGVASTKAFTTQLAALMALTDQLACITNTNDYQGIFANAMASAPAAVTAVLALEPKIKAMANHFVAKHHALFLGRGVFYPIAMEGALKLKEISYIHAEAYPAGELKHGPLALVDADMPVVAVAPNNALLEKLRSNLEEVRARGGELFVFADEASGFESGPGVHVLAMPHCDELAAPIAYTVALQLLSYYVAVTRGTDVDKPRNLAKSVTVE
jgi:glucosamine--fructose-6-phosphate aminotransferase (isomerizing)